jgi:hypothetical protein
MTTCTVEHYRDPDRPRRTADGYTICTGCATGLGRDLVALPKLHEDLVHLHGARRGGEDQTKISGTSVARLPIDVVVADMRADIRATVIEWTVYAAREAEAINASWAQRWLALDVASGAGWLNFNRDWCTQQEWTPDLVTAFRRVRSRAVRMLDPRPRQRFAIPGDDGQCVREVDAQPCPGRMWVTIPTTEEEASLIECNVCCHGYPPMSWLRLGKLVHARRVAA